MAEPESLSSSEQDSIQHDPSHEEASGADASSPAAEANSLSAAQQDVLERCLHVLTQAKNDSHILAALLLVRSKKIKQEFNKSVYRKSMFKEV